MIADAFLASLTLPPWLLAAGIAALAVASVALRKWARG